MSAIASYGYLAMAYRWSTPPTLFTTKMLKLCRKYLNWIQNSVFEGEITEVKLKELKYKATEIMEDDEDSLIIFSSRQEKWLEKEIIGKEKGAVDQFL